MSDHDTISALFAQLIIQQSNMAMMLLGKVPHPQTGETAKDTEAAKLFIDQLEMLEIKTKGNLSKEESGLLKQSLMSLRMTFVEAVESQGASHESGSIPETSKAEPAATQTAGESGADSTSSTASEEEHRKKFSKKY
jgi:hypothetical protein